VTIDFDPFALAEVQCPYAGYAKLRKEAPVYHVPATDFYLVTRYEDINYVLKTPEKYSAEAGVNTTDLRKPTPDIAAILRDGYEHVDVLATCDPPEHTHYRQFMNKQFTASAIAVWEPDAREVADRLIDGFESSGKVEFVEAFAIPLPLTMIARLLGVPEAACPDLQRWTKDFHDVLGGAVSEERRLECARGMVELQHFLAAQLQSRKSEPPARDLLSVLAHGRLDTGRELTLEEKISLASQVVVAGHDTITFTMTNSLRLLLDHPDEIRRLEDDAALIPGFIEEALRLDGAVQRIFRTAVEDSELGGVPIPAGSRVVAVYGSGSRDDTYFKDPDTFDVTRPVYKHQMGFGRGTHICLGAMLARMELRVAFGALLSRLDNIRVDLAAAGQLRYHPGLVLRGLERLPILFESR
jgi:cytochrome P450